MTLGNVSGETNPKDVPETRIGRLFEQTEDRAVIKGRREIEEITEIEPSESTSGNLSQQTPSFVKGTSEYETLVTKSRIAQASALFDPEAMALLETLVKKPLYTFEQLVEANLSPVLWVKLSILVRAYFVEPLDNGVRVTTEGAEALKKISKYLSKLDVEDQKQERSEED